MPSVLNRSTGTHVANAPAAASCGGVWSRHRDGISFDQLQKFWNEMPPRARHDLLRIDKQTLFEQARKNLYCSRCNGLLLEGFSQIVMYGKSLQQEGGAVMQYSNRKGTSMTLKDEESNGQDTSVHPWGGLAATRDGRLTLLDCFISAKSLKPLQNVFDSARARERERELLYPDACGGGGRGWISQGMANYGRGHGNRETCALHTARLSCDTLVDFWSALSDETRSSLLRMKEEDFIERLMYRFDNKRFCRDCRRNVIREFKELKELKRMRMEPRCTSLFCVADTAFQYEVSEDMVQADWHHSFTDTDGTYHHFEWAIGTGEGKSDILDFEDVGMNGNVQASGLDLGGLSACFITLRAWRLDGRCSEFSVKAHALKGQPCVHRRLVVGDGFVTIMKGESIRGFFEHAEEAEEEEDDDAMDKDGNDYDGDGSRPQKHAKSPELAREFLLDAATVIFKEQVEKAFREGTARQNAHSIFVCLALKLLEERVHVACKEIITLEKQSMLLEEEEKEKREEEERKERRRTKEREKKLRRKERIKGKERERERKQTSVNDSSTSTNDESLNSHDSGDSVSDPSDNVTPARHNCPDTTNKEFSNECSNTEEVVSDTLQHKCHVDGSEDGGRSSFIFEQRYSRRKLKSKNGSPLDQPSNWFDKYELMLRSKGGVQPEEYAFRPIKGHDAMCDDRSYGMKFNESGHGSNSRTRYDFHSCSCSHHIDHGKDVNYASANRSVREVKALNKKQSSFDMTKSLYRSSNNVIPKGKIIGTPKQVWEPMDPWKKCNRNNSDPDISSRSAPKIPSMDIGIENDDSKCQRQCNLLDPGDDNCAPELSKDLVKVGAFNSYQVHDDPSREGSDKCSAVTKSDSFLKDDAEEEVDPRPTVSTFTPGNGCDPMISSSSSDNCSSCLSEGDGSTSSSSARNPESSSTSDSEDASPQSDGRDASARNANAFLRFCDDSSDIKHEKIEEVPFENRASTVSVAEGLGDSCQRDEHARAAQASDNCGFEFDMADHQQLMMPMHSQSMHVPMFSSTPMGYHDQSAVPWSAAPTNGFVPFPQHSHYVFPSPLGYGIMANQPSDFCMRFTSVKPHAVINVQQNPICQNTNKPILASSKEQIQNSSRCGALQVKGVTDSTGVVDPVEGPFPSKQPPLKPSSLGRNGCVGNDVKSTHDMSSFSLFHFGGPIAGAAGLNLIPESLKDDAGGLPLTSITVPDDLSCSRKAMEVQEYSLFATNNSSRFSFF